MKIPVTWEMCGYADVPCKTPEEAYRYFEENQDHIKLPQSSSYVDASFRLSVDSEEELADYVKALKVFESRKRR